jgi:hypothetical protein
MRFINDYVPILRRLRVFVCSTSAFLPLPTCSLNLTFILLYIEIFLSQSHVFLYGLRTFDIIGIIYNTFICFRQAHGVYVCTLLCADYCRKEQFF